MDAAECDHIRLRLRRLVCKPERIADEVRQLLDFPHLVIVRQDHGIALQFQFLDFSGEIESGDGHGATYALVPAGSSGTQENCGGAVLGMTSPFFQVQSSEFSPPQARSELGCVP